MPWTDETIDTPRIRLRPFEERDKPAILELMTSADVRRYLGGPIEDPDVPAGVREAVVGERPDVFCITDRATDAAIGTCSRHPGHGEYEVSYELLPSWWGKGLASEALAAFLDWTWRHHEDESLIAVTQTANERSCRLLERLGFVVGHAFEEFDAMQSLYRIARPDDRVR